MEISARSSRAATTCVPQSRTILPGRAAAVRAAARGARRRSRPGALAEDLAAASISLIASSARRRAVRTSRRSQSASHSIRSSRNRNRTSSRNARAAANAVRRSSGRSAARPSRNSISRFLTSSALLPGSIPAMPRSVGPSRSGRSPVMTPRPRRNWPSSSPRAPTAPHRSLAMNVHVLSMITVTDADATIDSANNFDQPIRHVWINAQSRGTNVPNRSRLCHRVPRRDLPSGFSPHSTQH